MKRYIPITAVVICAAAFAAPAASAQTGPFNATYTEKIDAPHGDSKCPDDAFACGSGTATALGAISTERSFDESCGCVVRTLTFADGSTLALIETFVSLTGPGNSGPNSHESPKAQGNPGLWAWTWTADGGTGAFAGATGSGTDDFLSAGLIASGTINGTITTPLATRP
jgi:hypothetical protein